jgi:hypothetical protein
MLIGTGPAQRGTAIQPYRGAAILRKLFRKTVAAAVFGASARRHIAAAKKPVLAPRKFSRTSFATSLPQDSQAQLMFGAADLGDPALSASRCFGFGILPRGDRAVRRRTCCASASTDTGFRAEQGCSPRNAA